MSKINNIEQQLGLRFPDDYKEFLLKANSFVIENRVYCRILLDNYRTDGVIHEFHTIDNFMNRQEYRDYLFDFQNDFETPKDYVESEFLYHIADGTGSICIALGGQHYGKIYSVDNGDFGIIFQADSFNKFLTGLYDPSKFRCNNEALLDAVRNNNLTLLTELIETKDGNKLIEYSSSLDINLFEEAYNNQFDEILKYLISKGFRGYNRTDFYKLKY